MHPQLSRAGDWFLHSGIQESNGGVARYYRTDLARNHSVSTEITAYTISTLLYLHTLTQKDEYIARATAAARFLTRVAWDPVRRLMPFETSPAALTYFFDCGIIVRGLLSAWRATATEEFREVAIALGRSMARDFIDGNNEFHPILELPSLTPADCDPLRWSHSTGCYQLKAAMAWHDLAEVTGDPEFQPLYHRALENALRSYARFLPGHPDAHRVMDRLHAFLYFLEGLLPCASDPRYAAALCDGIRRTAHYLHEIAPEFERSDVYAQLLRIRIYAAHAGAAPLDRADAEREAATLETFQAENGGFFFGRKNGVFLPYENPVSTAFALQALALWDGQSPDRRLLI